MMQAIDMPTAVITGATSGIGLVTARELARTGMRVFALGRDKGRIKAVSQAITEAVPGGRVEWILADFGSLEQVAQASAEILETAGTIDLLVNNAGNQLDRRITTGDGFEMTWQVNHLAPFLMTKLLLPRVLESPQPQVITVSSIGHSMIPDMVWDDLQGEAAYSPYTAYFQSKLANVLFTRELAARNASTPLVASAVHPGLVSSDFANKCDPAVQDYYAKAAESGEALTSEQGADTVIWLATDHAQGRPSGGYFYQRERLDPSTAAMNPASAERLWAISEEQVRAFA